MSVINRLSVKAIEHEKLPTSSYSGFKSLFVSFSEISWKRFLEIEEVTLAKHRIDEEKKSKYHFT